MFFPLRWLFNVAAMLTGMRLKKELLPPAPPVLHIPIECKEPTTTLPYQRDEEPEKEKHW